MRIAGFEKISLQDFPDHVSCIIFTQGCNMRCPFCQNSTLIPMESDSLIDEDEILEYITLRKKVLDGVVISGGEPTLQKDLKEFIKKVKDIGLDVKLDTNGMNFTLLQELVEENLVDYVAMDIKNNFSKYDMTAGLKNSNVDNISKSIEFLKTKKVDFEFRTTIIKQFHKLEDIKEIITYVGDNKYYLQNFRDSEYVIDHNLSGFSDEELKIWNEKLKDFPNVYIRGIEKE